MHDLRDRCAAAGIGGDIDFATKPELAMVMLERCHFSNYLAGSVLIIWRVLFYLCGGLCLVGPDHRGWRGL